MTLVRFNTQPVFTNALNHFFMNPERSESTNPSVNVYNTDEAFVLELSVPGYTKNDISINLEQKTLRISAGAPKNETEDSKYLRREFSIDGFSRSFVLPKNIDTEKISAGFNNGILKITLPRVEETVVKKEISIS